MSKVKSMVTGILAALGAIVVLGMDASSHAVEQSVSQEIQKTNYQKRQAAKERLQEMMEKRNLDQVLKNASRTPQGAFLKSPEEFMTDMVGTPNGIHPSVDISLPNFANSPNLRKFVDSLPGLGAATANNLGQYIPVAVPDTTSYPGSDYYEIALVQYREQMHSDLPPVVGAKTDPAATGGTLLRGYVQLNGGDPTPHYMGPVILARKGVPVRILFTNMLPTGSGGDLFIPVDTSIMGSGMFHTMNMEGNMIMGMFPQNRSAVHLHGGLTPWISDGTPHQWITPAGELTPYPQGVAVSNVPDMPDPGRGSLTLYFPNEQSSRLMFYHDHAYGITRLNVYAGVAAGYVITDQVEDDLIDGTNISEGNPSGAQVLPNLGGLYRYGIPLVIQDKSFVNDANTPPHESFPASYTPTALTAAVDPLWYQHLPNSAGGELWWPHEYLPNENLFDPSGFWYMGRWDYGPWILPPMFPMNDTLPSPSHVPEAFMDTAVVNGTAFPYVELPPTAVRFRILNACNDRMLNLQFYKADPANPTEVKMVPAVPNPLYPTWPADGRDGGVPDPTLTGPDIIQIGNECGFLAKVAVLPAQPIDYDYDRTSATFGNVNTTSLFLPPAVRADIIVDLSAYQDGDTLILYNDAPAPMSLFDARYDYFTDAQDWTLKGGAPPSAPGFGPNTRTIMQIRIKGTSTGSFSLPALQAALPKAFAVGQDPIIVPAAAYNDAYGTSYTNVYANIADETLNLTGTPQPVARVVTELPGLGYTSPPLVRFFGGGGTGATAEASLNGVAGVTLVTSGSGYTSAPTVTFTGGGGSGATAEAVISGGVITSIVITNPGSNYTTAPIVSILGGGGSGASAVATITIGSVGAITITNPGSGYTKAPYVTLTGGGGMGATAIAMLNGAMVLDGKTLVEGMDMEYGRMNAVLGSIPNPLTPTVGAGPVVGAAFYIDPPTEKLIPDQTLLWRIMHIGVDSHSLHFHLFNVQVVNRVDWTNTTLPPYDEEFGWKETIRTNPFEDIIVALRPNVSTMKLPFGVPNSVRLLDPTMPMGEIGHFTPVAPPPGLPAVAQLTNEMTNFGWEYVWHCHLLGHEENDMMRPLVINVPSTVAAAPQLTAALVGTQINLNWIDPTPFDYATGLPVSTLGNPANEIGFRIERAEGDGAFTILGTALANKTSFTDTTAVVGTTYRYRVFAYNAAGDSPASNVASVAVETIPAAPTNLRASVTGVNYVILSWTDHANNEQGFYFERSADGGTTWSRIGRTGANSTSFRNSGLTTKTRYLYRVQAYNAAGNSDFTNILTVITR